MLRICAWCNKKLDGENNHQSNRITHGICESCRVAFLSTLGPRSIHTYLNYFSLPILMVDANAHVLSANNAALALTCKKLSEVTGELGGDVMNCKYAQLEGGCGETTHCVACTIRNTVIQTHTTGESYHEVPSDLTIDNDGQEMTLYFQISTEKVDEMVLLRIDRIEEK